MKLTPGDKAQAEALRIAEDWLKWQGSRFDPSDVGKKASEILVSMVSSAALQDQER